MVLRNTNNELFPCVHRGSGRCPLLRFSIWTEIITIQHKVIVFLRETIVELIAVEIAIPICWKCITGLRGSRLSARGRSARVFITTGKHRLTGVISRRLEFNGPLYDQFCVRKLSSLQVFRWKVQGLGSLIERAFSGEPFNKRCKTVWNILISLFPLRL